MDGSNVRIDMPHPELHDHSMFMTKFYASVSGRKVGGCGSS